VTDVSYVYALIRSDRADLTGLPTGIEGGVLRIVDTGRVGAVVSSVPGDLFSPDGLEQRLGDLEWVERTARAHDAVVDAAAASTTTLPLRLGTTCADDDAVVALLVDLESAALRTFVRLDGRREWGVRLLGRPPGARSAAQAGESGASFLARRRAELQQRDNSEGADGADADTVYAALAGLAHEARRHAAADRAGGLGSGPRVVLNAAFLVDVADSEAFLNSAKDLQARLGADRVIVSGPWAAYSFAELEGS
jgi:hypothetical protein